jgi:hypothetical protein
MYLKLVSLPTQKYKKIKYNKIVFAGLLNKGFRGSLALLITIFILFMVATYFVSVPIEIRNYPNLFYNYFAIFLNQKAAVVLINFVLIALGVFLINSIAVNQEITDKQNYFPVFIYMMLCIACVDPFQISQQAFSNVFVLFSVYRLLDTYRKENVLGQIFEAAFWLCLSSFITISITNSFPLFFIVLFILRPFYWREWVVAILGFFVPIFIYECTAYLSSFNRWYFFNATSQYFEFLKLPSFSEYYLPLSLLLSVLLFISIAYGLLSGFGNTVKKQRSKSILLWYLFFAVPEFFSGGANSSSIILTFAFPLSFFIGDFLFGLKQLKITNTILSLFLFCILIIFFRRFGWI